MAVDTPFANPTAYDSITIDGVDTPGVCTLKGGGARKVKIEAYQAPGYMGAYTVYRGEEVPAVDYELRLWTQEQYQAAQALRVRLIAAQRTRPPKILKLIDLQHDISQVCVLSVDPFRSPKNGIWLLAFSFMEWRKRRPIGGVPQPADNDARREIARLSEENPRLEQQLQAAEVAAQREGVGGRGILGVFGL